MSSHYSPFQPGDRFAKWEIRKLIGKGGHAFVYEAHDPFLGLDVALKVIPSPRDTGRDLIDRARAEARVLVRIAHPNVVQVKDAGATEDGLVYIVMEKLTGRDLRKALKQYGRLTPAEALIIAIQAAEAVAAAHAVGAIHRDLKPENIFLGVQNVVKVLDFGVAKVMGYGAKTTEKDRLHGTLLYMSPEQLKGFGVTHQSDIFSLGTLLYEALCRHPALLGDSVPTEYEVGWIQIGRLPPPLNEIDTSIPSYVARFVQRAIMKNPEQRYQSMAEMAEVGRATLHRLRSERPPNAPELSCRDLSEGPPDYSVSDASFRPLAAGLARPDGREPGAQDETPAPVNGGVSEEVRGPVTPSRAPRPSSPRGFFSAAPAFGLSRKLFAASLATGLLAGTAVLTFGFVHFVPASDSAEKAPSVTASDSVRGPTGPRAAVVADTEAAAAAKSHQPPPPPERAPAADPPPAPAKEAPVRRSTSGNGSQPPARPTAAPGKEKDTASDPSKELVFGDDDQEKHQPRPARRKKQKPRDFNDDEVLPSSGLD